MFLRYAYRKENGKLVLYLYKTTQFEFAQENLVIEDEPIQTLEEEAIHYIKENKLPLSFDKVYILIDGNIVKTIPKDQFSLEERELHQRKKNETTFLITLRDGDKEKQISLFQYLMGSLFANIPFPLHQESLKALVILYRTYALDKLNEVGYIEAKNSFITYKDPFIYKFTYLERFQEIYDKYKEAILKTKGLYLLSNGKPIKPYIHFVSSGYTKENKKDTYLVSKNSLWDMKAKNYLQQFFFSYSDLAKRFSLHQKSTNNLHKSYSKKEIACILGLPSFDFTCIEEKDGMTFLSRGIGNDLGLSLFGANYLAEQGFSYSQILAYYFQNIMMYQL